MLTAFQKYRDDVYKKAVAPTLLIIQQTRADLDKLGSRSRKQQVDALAEDAERLDIRLAEAKQHIDVALEEIDHGRKWATAERIAAALGG